MEDNMEEQSKTGLKKTLLEYITSFEIGKEKLFSDRVHLNNYINFIFRTDYEQNYTNEKTVYNQYFSVAEMLNVFSLNFSSPYLEDRKEKRDRCIAYLNKNEKRNRKLTYKSFRNDTLTFSFSEDFQQDYDSLDDEHKIKVCSMLLQYAMKTYSDIMLKQHQNTSTVAIVLHADRNDFEIYRLYAIF